MTKLRADARRNREQIVDAAGVLFAESGPDVPMEEIARRAGVGVGTLYRRFPDRDALVGAVAFESLHRVVARARAANEEPDGWTGLTRFVQRSVADFRLATWLSMWFAKTWTALQLEPEHAELRAELLRLLERLVGRAQREGAMRTDVGGGDFAQLLAVLLRPLPATPATPAAAHEQMVERNLVIMLDGLRAGPNTVLPGRPVTADELVHPAGAHGQP